MVTNKKTAVSCRACNKCRAPRKIGILPPTCGYEKAAMEAAGRRKD